MSIWKIKLPPFGGRQEDSDDLCYESFFYTANTGPCFFLRAN
jgi:hypothetical protein